MKRIVIASDSFKGSLTSVEVAQSATKGILEVYPDCKVTQVNVADGGEGTVDAVVDTLQGEKITISVSNPIGKPVDATYGIAGDTAIIEMAAASGLPLLAAEERNPWVTSTYGTGEMILDAIARGCSKFLVGIGGSATNDAGTGMLQALGFRFFDNNGILIENCCGGILGEIASIDDTQVPEAIKNAQFTVACDVDTPFCGPIGAAYVFAPQKGASPEMVQQLDEGMASFAKVIEAKYGIDIVPMAGAGAAGGMGGGFRAFLNATLKKGIDMVLDAIGFDSIISGADLVVTGEGKVDFQTAKGKTAAGVLARAKAQGIPVVAIGGCVEMCDSLREMGFAGIYPILEEKVPLELAMQRDFASQNVTNTLIRILSQKE
ncbi:MAG: glycerate kinase [Muribaculaceae bacterium]|nr:glycerate kinase [Muribaculaceae bacterium]MEE1298193.1 glycerate kinase [Muribaculaceae bacterium]